MIAKQTSIPGVSDEARELWILRLVGVVLWHQVVALTFVGALLIMPGLRMKALTGISSISGFISADNFMVSGFWRLLPISFGFALMVVGFALSIVYSNRVVCTTCRGIPAIHYFVAEPHRVAIILLSYHMSSPFILSGLMKPLKISFWRVSMPRSFPDVVALLLVWVAISRTVPLCLRSPDSIPRPRLFKAKAVIAKGWKDAVISALRVVTISCSCEILSSFTKLFGPYLSLSPGVFASIVAFVVQLQRKDDVVGHDLISLVGILVAVGITTSIFRQVSFWMLAMLVVRLVGVGAVWCFLCDFVVEMLMNVIAEHRRLEAVGKKEIDIISSRKAPSGMSKEQSLLSPLGKAASAASDTLYQDYCFLHLSNMLEKLSPSDLKRKLCILQTSGSSQFYQPYINWLQLEALQPKWTSLVKVCLAEVDALAESLSAVLSEKSKTSNQSGSLKLNAIKKIYFKLIKSSSGYLLETKGRRPLRCTSIATAAIRLLGELFHGLHRTRHILPAGIDKNPQISSVVSLPKEWQRLGLLESTLRSLISLIYSLEMWLNSVGDSPIDSGKVSRLQFRRYSHLQSASSRSFLFGPRINISRDLLASESKAARAILDELQVTVYRICADFKEEVSHLAGGTPSPQHARINILPTLSVPSEKIQWMMGAKAGTPDQLHRKMYDILTA